MNLSEFLRTPLSVLAPLKNEACVVCGRRVFGETDHAVDGHDVHDDCYFAVHGETVERSGCHPT